MPVQKFSYTATLKSLIPLQVRHPLPSIGLELYQLGVHTRAKNTHIVTSQKGILLKGKRTSTDSERFQKQVKLPHSTKYVKMIRTMKELI